jgi:hypothetical protein
MDDWLVDLTLAPQQNLGRRAAARFVYETRRALQYTLDGTRGRAECWQGLEKDSGQPLRAVYIGDEQSYRANSPDYLKFILFQPESVKTDEAGSFPMRQARAQAENMAADYDLVIYEGSSLLRGMLRWSPAGGASLVVPIWVRMALTIPPGADWEELENGMRKHKRNIQLVQRNGYTFRISHSDEDFEFFYEHMHLPMISARHPCYGKIDLKSSMRAQLRRGHLMLIDTAEGQPVVGALNLLRGKAIFGIANGTLDGDSHWHDKGAVSALYYYAIRWSYENGITHFDAGGVRPFASDGLYRYKRYWGLTPRPDLWNSREWLFWAPPHASGQCAPVAQTWLQSHPPVNLE